jgi:hypothetical protein
VGKKRVENESMKKSGRKKWRGRKCVGVKEIVEMPMVQRGVIIRGWCTSASASYRAQHRGLGAYESTGRQCYEGKAHISIIVETEAGEETVPTSRAFPGSPWSLLKFQLNNKKRVIRSG